jgi:hypothetical protein
MEELDPSYEILSNMSRKNQLYAIASLSNGIPLTGNHAMILASETLRKVIRSGF